MQPEPDSPSREKDFCLDRWTGYALLVCFLVTFFRLAYLAWLCPYNLAQDEAHYWDWSRHLDWSYYSKGPLVAWLIALSNALMEPLVPILGCDPALRVRLFAPMFGGGFLLGLFFFLRFFNRRIDAIGENLIRETRQLTRALVIGLRNHFLLKLYRLTDAETDAAKAAATSYQRYYNRYIWL
ncbi:MAG: hypothetical protein EBS53_16470, partial [Bacteroidetes bacterium]|nr:hypothetical protein [Bacteroidota bacterium]